MDWRLNDAHREKTNSLRNFPMQATCADILRLACCLTTEAATRERLEQEQAA
jgi:hypothetical protein